MPPTLSTADQAILDEAAGLLLHVGRRDGDLTEHPAVAAYSLLAAQQLHTAGANPTQTLGTLPPTDPATAIRRAITLLATLTDAVFDRDLVADAVDDAQDAYTAATG